VADYDFCGPLTDIVVRVVRYSPSNIDEVGDNDARHAEETRRKYQVSSAVGGQYTQHGGVEYPAHVRRAVYVAAWHPEQGHYYAGDAWREPVFRAAVRACADPGWADRFAASLAAATRLGGPGAVRDVLLAELPPFETADDRRRRAEEERVHRDHSFMQEAFDAQDGDA
jgi:pimeloyl-ACP methyl ester carboxylesterase